MPRMNRNLIEKERRSQMRSLFSQLFNLLPPHPTKMPIPVMVDHATVYISQLQKRLEELKQRKVQLIAEHDPAPLQAAVTSTVTTTPAMDITDSGSTVEVNLISGKETNFVLCDIISILQEEGAQVLSVTYKNEGNKLFISIHSQEAYPRIGIDKFRVRERLKKIYDFLKESAAAS